MSINLYQPVEQQKKGSAIDRAIVYSVGILLIIVATYGGITMYTQYAFDQEIAKTKDAIKMQEAKLSSDEANKIYDTALRLNQIASMEKSVKMTDALSKIESFMVGGSWLTSFAYDHESEIITLKGSVNSLDILAKQLYNFRTNAIFPGTRVESLGVDTNGKHTFVVQVPVSAQ